MEDHAARSTVLRRGKHPTLAGHTRSARTRRWWSLRYLGDDFTCYIVSGGGRDSCGRSPAPSTGSHPSGWWAARAEVRRRDGHGDLLIQPHSTLDDGPEKPVRSGTGSAGGRSWGGQIQRRRRDADVLGSPEPALRLLVLHDDAGANSPTPQGRNARSSTRRVGGASSA